MSEGNKSSIKIARETTYGTTPTAPALIWKPMRFTSFSMSAAPKTVISNEIKSNRQVGDLIMVGYDIMGEMGFELSAVTFDTLFEGLMYDSSWPLNVGNTAANNQFSIEAEYDHNGTPHFLQYKGCRVGGMSLNFPYGKVCEGSFKFAGKTALNSATSLVTGTATLAAVPTGDVIHGSLNGSKGVTVISLGGVSGAGIIKSVSLNVDNSLRPVEAMLSIGPSNQNAGRAMVTGEVEMYFDNMTQYQKLLDNTNAGPLTWTVGDGMNTYTYTVTNLKFNSGSPDISGVDTDNMIKLAWTGLYDVSTTSLQIAKT